MSDLSSYTQRDAFYEKVYSIVDEYLQESETHEENVYLGINIKTKETKIDTQLNFDSKWTLYPIAKLIRTNDNDSTDEVDIDYAFEIASTNYFVR